MKLTILDGNAVNPGDTSWDAFGDYADITIYPRTSKEETVEHIGDSDAVLLNKVLIDKAVLDACPKLKYIGVLATGYNVVDLMAANEAGVVVTNIPTYSTNAVAQHTFALIMHFSNKVAFHNDDVHKGGWVNALDFCYWKEPLFELSNKTLGIFGYGSIGKIVARIAKSFGMLVVATPHTLGTIKDEGVTEAAFNQMISQSDIVTLHAPLTFETRHIINADSLARMKKGSLLINTARGGLVSETDVKFALINGQLSGYACDVIETEPMRSDCPLLQAPNCVITSHLAWAALETRQRLLQVALDNFANFLEGNKVNVVTQ